MEQQELKIAASSLIRDFRATPLNNNVSARLSSENCADTAKFAAGPEAAGQLPNITVGIVADRFERSYEFDPMENAELSSTGLGKRSIRSTARAGWFC